MHFYILYKYGWIIMGDNNLGDAFLKTGLTKIRKLHCPEPLKQKTV